MQCNPMGHAALHGVSLQQCTAGHAALHCTALLWDMQRCTVCHCSTATGTRSTALHGADPGPCNTVLHSSAAGPRIPAHCSDDPRTCSAALQLGHAVLHTVVMTPGHAAQPCTALHSTAQHCNRDTQPCTVCHCSSAQQGMQHCTAQHCNWDTQPCTVHHCSSAQQDMQHCTALHSCETCSTALYVIASVHSRICSTAPHRAAQHCSWAMHPCTPRQ